MVFSHGRFNCQFVMVCPFHWTWTCPPPHSKKKKKTRSPFFSMWLWPTSHVAHVLLVGRRWHVKKTHFLLTQVTQRKGKLKKRKKINFIIKETKKWNQCYTSDTDWYLSLFWLLAKVQIRTETVTPHSHFVFVVKKAKKKGKRCKNKKK